MICSTHLLTVICVALILALAPERAVTQCSELASGLLNSRGITQSNLGNIIVAESGTLTSNSGRISIVDRSGTRRTLLDGLPSGISDVGDPSGPTSVYMRGRTLFVTVGAGDVGLPGPFPGTDLENPNPASPLLSSVLAVHFSANVEMGTLGITLTLEDHEALANGETLVLSSGNDHVSVSMVANFPNFIANPLQALPNNIRLSNPYDLVAVGSQIYVTDGGRNLVWKVDTEAGTFSTLVEFPPIPNPIAGFAPFLDAVPTGIAYSGGQLLVNLFRGVPFPPGVSTVEQVDPNTGNYSSLITGRKAAIDVIPVKVNGETSYFVLQHASTGLFFGSPGVVLWFEGPTSPPITVANCLSRPTSMVLNPKSGTLYVAEYSGRIVAIAAN
jgi:hypothetical protein